MGTVFSIVLLAAVLWFAVLNANAVTITLFFWEVESSLALIVGVSLAVGFVFGVLRVAPGFWRYKISSRRFGKDLKSLQTEKNVLLERSRVLEEQIRSLSTPLRSDEKDG